MQPASAPIRSDRIEVRELDEGLKLALVERHGDPKPAVALALAHDQGSWVSVALSALFERRLALRGYPTVVRQAHDMGFQLATLVTGGPDAERFVIAARASLEGPIAENDPALASVQQALELFLAQPELDTGARAVSACSGELHKSGRAVPDIKTADGRAELERWRRELVTTAGVSFAAVGPRDVLDQTARAHERALSWQAGSPPGDQWPAADVASIQTESAVEPTITVALRVADASRTIVAANQLARPDSGLKRKLEALVPGWTLERSVATARVRGACLRLDMRIKEGAPSVIEEVARVAFLAEREAELALARATSDSFVLDQRILMAEDPRQAAALAAWRAHVSRQPTGPARRAIHVLARPNLSKRATSELLAQLDKFAAGKLAGSERRVAVEPGQGEVWMLLGSRCGTANESADDAGHSALLMSALAELAHGRDGVSIEPWVAPEAIGLLAHAPRLSVRETPAEHAARVGRALADAFALTPISFQHTAVARQELLAKLGPEPRFGWWTTVRALAPEHPSWLSPLGTFDSIGEASKTSLERRRQALLSEPLRAAIIANRDRNQAQAGLAALERWLSPMRGKLISCAGGDVEPQTGQIELAPSSGDPQSDAGAFVGVRTPVDRMAADATRYLLNRKGGWLDQALAVPGLVTSARAHSLGGARQQALVVEVHALDGKTSQAVDQVRALLDRLSQGASTAADLGLAQRHLEAQATILRLSPRGRIVELWGDPDRDQPLTLERLREFQRSLASRHHLVVTRKPGS